MKTQSIAALITAFSFIISTLYLYAYWTPFGINIFDHLTTSEILVRSVTPLFLCTGVFITTALLEIHEDELTPGIQEIKKQRTSVDKITHMILSTIGLQMIAIGAIIQYRLNTNLHITIYSVGATLLAVQLMIKTGTYHKLINKHKIPKSAVHLSVILTAMTASYAYTNAENIKDRISYTRAEIELTSSKEKLRHIYIGETQNTIFFHSFLSKKVIEISRKEISTIVKSDSSCKECQFPIEKQSTGKN